MNAVFTLLNAVQAGGTPVGVVATKGTATAANGAAAGETSFASELVQALLGESAALVPMQATLSGESGIASFLFGPTADEAQQPGDLLEQWLSGLQSEADLSDAQDALDGLLTLLALAQAVVQSWQSDASAAEGTSGETQPAMVQLPEALLNSKHGELLNTMRQLVALMRQHPDQAEIVQIVQAFEQSLAPLVTKESGTAAPSAAALLTASATAEGNGQASAASASTTAAAAPVHKQTAATRPADNASSAQTTGAFPAAGSAGGDRSSRLEALAAKAGFWPQWNNAVSAESSETAEAPAESFPAADSADADVIPLQAHQSARPIALSQTPAEPQSPVVHADRFADEMAQLLKSMKVRSQGGMSEVRVTLHPEHLGQVDVKVSLHNGQVVAQFAADSAHGKQLLESQLAQLRAVLHSQGLQVDRLEVTQYSTAFSGAFQDARQQPRQFERRSQAKPDDYEQTTIDFRTELAGLSAGERTRIAQSSFDVSA